MSRFYRVDYRKVSLPEYWNLSPNWKGIVAWLMKIFGHPLREPNAYPHPSTYRELQVPEDQLPAEAATAVAGARRDIEQLGFHSPKWIHQPPLYMSVSSVCGTYVHNSGELIGRIMHTKAQSGTITIERLTVVLLTPFTDGRVLVTTNVRPSFRPPPNVIIQRRVDASAAVLYDLHLKGLKALSAAVEIRKIQNVEECETFADEYEEECFEFNVRRGLYVVLTEEQMTQRKNEKKTVEAALAGGQRYPNVFVEIDRIQNKKASWTSTLVILGVSIAAFVALGAFHWSWETVVILVAVLFFHELGHYLAMRIFKYQNLKMFFIPLFGAAVSGRNYNVKGWQKAIVSLAGPVPGIILGGIIGIFALVTDQPWASKVALMALLLNGINLLPVLPLDGGWLMHALLFCRRYWLEGAFHLLAGLIMVGYRLAGGENIFLFLGILMLFTSPMAFRLARVAHRLRARGISGISRDQQTIPHETGAAIVDEVKASIPGAHSDKTLATLTLDVFQKLNATPPSIGASILLFVAYMAPLIFALLFGGILIAGRAGFAGFTQPSTVDTPPVTIRHEYACNTSQSKGPTDAVPLQILILTFDTVSDAQNNFSSAATNDPQGAVTLFGQSIFHASAKPISLSTNKSIALEYPTSNYVVSVFLTCEADSESAAIALADELEAYLDLASRFLLVPSWVPQPGLSAGQQAGHQLARRTLREIQAIKSAISRDPEYAKLSKEFLSTLRRKKMSPQSERLVKQMNDRAREITHQKLTELKAAPTDFDVALVDLHLREPNLSDSVNDYPEWWKEVTRRIGPAPETETGLPASAEGWFGARYGQVKRDGSSLRFDHLSFRRTDLGLPAFADFLCSRGCSNIRYTIIGDGLEYE